MLTLKNLVSGYGDKQVVNEVNLEVAKHNVVGIIGHNGAGKTTLLHTIFGLVAPWRGDILYNDENLSQRSAAHRVRKGIRLLPSSQSIFPGLSVDENMKLVKEQVQALQEEKMVFDAQAMYELFPELVPKRKALAGNLSGGQQRMLAVSMGLIGKPNLLLLDELSLGLAPALVQRILGTLLDLSRKHGFGMLIIEQSVGELQAICDRFVVMRNGSVISDQSAQDVTAEQLWELF
jgi:branched-chain amino acid transport system ATP-binding protein